VAEEVSKFGSDEWLPALRNLCIDFLKNLKGRPGGRFLCFRDELIGTKEKPGEIVKEYHRTANELKKVIFGDNASKEHLDYHKIAALYIRSFLKYRPFYFDVPDETKYFETCLNTKLANEYFAVIYLATIIKCWKNDLNGTLEIDAKYKFDFIKLLYRYKIDIDKLDPLALADVIYLIEKRYFKPSKP